MPLYKFDQNDIFHNRIDARPQCNFFIYSGSTYYNNRPQLSGAFTASVPTVPPGYTSLYEMNVDRVTDDKEVSAVGTITVLDSDEITAGDYIRLVATNGAVYELTAHDSTTTTEHTLTPTFDIKSFPDFTAGEIQKAIDALDDFTATWPGDATTPGVSTTESRTVTITQLTSGHLGNTVIEGYDTLVSSGDAVTLDGFSDGNSVSHIRSYIIRTLNNDYIDYRRPQYALDDLGRLILAADLPVNVDHPEDIILTGSYPMSASISKEYLHVNHVTASSTAIVRAVDIGVPFPDSDVDHPTRAGNEPVIRTVDPITTDGQHNWETYGISPKSTLGSKISALKNTLDSYTYLSHHYAYSSASLAMPSHTADLFLNGDPALSLIHI